MTILKEQDLSLDIIRSKKVLIVGLGNQGMAQALNLRDSGVTQIAAGLRTGSANAQKARDNGLEVMDIATGAAWADLIMILAPDEVHGEIYEAHIRDVMKPGAAIGFAHGFSVRFGLVKPRSDIDVVLMAPKGPGHTLRSLYKEGLGMPCLVGVEQDASGEAMALAQSYAAALGSGKAGVLTSSFAEECETDLFSEQAILCGGMPWLIKAGYETLIEAGYTPEVAYIECLHEVKQIADLLWQGGLDYMNHAISNTAEFGGYVTGERMIDDHVRATMKEVLADVQSGKFSRQFLADVEKGAPHLLAERKRDSQHSIEAAGERVRSLMPWLKTKK